MPFWSSVVQWFEEVKWIIYRKSLLFETDLYNADFLSQWCCALVIMKINYLVKQWICFLIFWSLIRFCLNMNNYIIFRFCKQVQLHEPRGIPCPIPTRESIGLWTIHLHLCPLTTDFELLIVISQVFVFVFNAWTVRTDWQLRQWW